MSGIRATDVALAILVAAVWGLAFVAIRIGLSGMSPLLLVAFRYALATVPAIFFVERPKVGWRYLATYALLMAMAYPTLLFVAIELGMPSGLSSVLVQTQAFFTLCFAMVFLRERLHVHNVLGGVLAASGLALIALRFDVALPAHALLMTLGAAVAWGCSNIVVAYVTRTHGQTDPVAFTIWSGLLAPAPMLAVALLMDRPTGVWQSLSSINATGWLAVLFMAYPGTVLAFGLWAKLIARYGAGRIAPFSLLTPVFGLGSTALALGEPITPMTLVAGALILVGLTVNVFGGAFLRHGQTMRACDTGRVG